MGCMDKSFCPTVFVPNPIQENLSSDESSIISHIMIIDPYCLLIVTIDLRSESVAL
jgi:hypothetical protein